MKIKQCTECLEPTKIATGFWDGKDKSGKPTGGYLYDCNNPSCQIRQEKLSAENAAIQKEKAAQEENRKNGIDITKMKKTRAQAEMTMRDCAEVLGVSMSRYCDYVYEREPMPPQEWQRIMAIAKEDQQ